MVTVVEPKFQILLQRSSHNNRLADTYRNANVWYLRPKPLCNLRALICFMEHIAADIKLYLQVQFNYEPRKAHQSFRGSRSDAGANATLEDQLPLQLPSSSGRSSVAGRQSPASDPSSFSVPHYYYPRFEFSPVWSGNAALQFICKAYPKMLMGLLYVGTATAGGISQCPSRSLSF